MRFRSGASLDASQVSDRRGIRAGPVALGGTGLLGLLVVLALQFFGGTDGASTGGFLTGADPFGAQGAQVSGATDECRTGADAEQSQECRIVAVVNSIQDYWSTAMRAEYRAGGHQLLHRLGVDRGVRRRPPRRSGPSTARPTTRSTSTWTSSTCSSRHFGASGGDFAEAYVLAHEYGHHVQDLLGIDADRATRARVGDRCARS